MTTVLAESDWQPRQAAHEQRVDARLAGHLARARAGRPHPVEDFLFTYYSYRPAQLRRWHPGAGFALGGPSARERLEWREHVERVGGAEPGSPTGGSPNGGSPTGGSPTGVGLDVPAFLERRAGAVRQVVALLSATASRPAQLGCFGLHEWAMAYRQPPEELRHARWPLRLGPEGTDEVVESHRIRCSHHDAFRFFTAPARPRNQLQPGRSNQIELEQPGCLHATMDLYKWAYKLTPAIGSELTLDCFDLARRAREIDMRAAPYDLSSLGYAPIRIETAEGKAEYVAAQREIAERGQVLRARLLAAARDLAECARTLGPTLLMRAGQAGSAT
jgi:hypothetical protein